MNLSPLRLEDYPEDRHPLVRAILKCGGNPASFSRLLGIPHQNIRRWLLSKNNSTTPKYCADIERLTYGEITRKQLRPDVFGEPDEPYPSMEERLQKCIGTLTEIANDLYKKSKKRGK